MYLTIIINTCSGTASIEGAGASQIQRGIPHLHSLTPDTGVVSEFCRVFECKFASMSSLDIVSVMLFTASEEACVSSFPDLCQT